MSNTINDPIARRYNSIGTGLATTIYIYLLLPIIVTIPMAFGPTNALSFPPTSYSFDLFGIFLTSEAWLSSLSTSLKVAAASTLLALTSGVPCGYWIARHDFVGKGIFTGLLMSPLIIPHIVAGLGLFLYFSYIRISGTMLSIVLGHVMITLPFVVVMTVAGVKKLDPNLEFGAELMGAGPLRMFFTVVIPQLTPSLLSAGFFAFLLSFDEIIISWFLAGQMTVTLPVRMYTALQWELSPVLAAVATLLTALSLMATIVAIALRKAPTVEI